MDVKHHVHLLSFIVQELCESPAGRPNEPSGFRGRKAILEPCFGIGLSLFLICKSTSEDIVLTELTVSLDVSRHPRTLC